jgi:hypothetical protein
MADLVLQEKSFIFKEFKAEGPMDDALPRPSAQAIDIASSVHKNFCSRRKTNSKKRIDGFARSRDSCQS